LLWPNAESAVNSDPWLVANHDRIRSLQPRVLVVNFVHGLCEAAARGRVERLRAVLRESSRWHGYRDPGAPPCLDYDVVGIVDLTEPRGRLDRNSARFPRTADEVGFDYAALHELRLHDGLTLDELTARGLVNEVWLLADHTERSAPWETVEVKQAYDDAFRPLAGFEPHAGNSGAHDAPWLGRSLRILFINFDRGVGCAMESLGHSLERMASCGARSPTTSTTSRISWPRAATSTSRPTAASTTTSTTRSGSSRRSRPGASRGSRRVRGRPPSSSATAIWRRTAWAAGSPTGARTCRGWTTPHSTTRAAR
jgi:hypothetical protein